MAAAGLIMSLLQMLGQGAQTSQAQGGAGGLTGMISGTLGRDTSDRGSFLNTIDPGGGFVDKKTMEARGMDKKEAVLSNLTGGLFGGKGKKAEDPTIEEMMDRMKAWERAQPEYIAYNQALEGMTPESGYGAITPDWGKMLDRTIKKTQQVYRGGPTSTGIMDKLRSDVAARGMTSSPALAKQMLSLGAQESQDIGDVSARIAEQERAMTEAARMDWLNRRQSLAGYGTTQPNLSQLFGLDAIQNPPPAQQDYSGIGSMLSGLMGSKTAPQQAVPTSGQFSGSYDYLNQNPYGLGLGSSKPLYGNETSMSGVRLGQPRSSSFLNKSDFLTSDQPSYSF